MNELVQKGRAPAHAAASGQVKEGRTTRTNDPDRTMANIIEVALAEFADKGLAGARIDEIAAATRTSKRMIYYYFGSKEALYLAVLEECYRRVRHNEGLLSLEELEPVEGLRKLVEYTFDHHSRSENYIRLVMSENMNRGEYLAQSRFIQELNVPAISSIRRLYERGVAQKVFRPGLEPVEIHAAISALTFFNVSNRYTFGMIFKRDFSDPEIARERKRAIVEMVTRYVCALESPK
jgi:AcrR family transcriptional regulator